MSKWDSGKFKELMRKIVYSCYGSVLDVGCGQGEFVFKYGNAIGIDLKSFDEWNSDNRFCVSRVEDFVFDGFDTVLFNNSFEHFEKKDLVLNKCFQQDIRCVFVLPTTKHLIKCWLRLPKASILKALGRSHEDIRYLLVHSFNVYGYNFFEAFKDFGSWEVLLKEYFGVVEVKLEGDCNIFVCKKKECVVK